MPGSVRRQKRAIAISAPVLPAETATSASPFFTASMASHIEEVLRPRRSAWLGLSCMADGNVGVDDARDLLQRGMLLELGIDLGAVAEQQELGVGMPVKRDRGAGNDDRSADIATHGVKRYSNLLRHERPGNLISCGLDLLEPPDWMPWRNAARPSAAQHPAGARQ